MHRNDDVRFISSSIKIPPPPKPLKRFPFQTPPSHSNHFTRSVLLCCATLSLPGQRTPPSPILCSASLSLAESTQPREGQLKGISSSSTSSSSSSSVRQSEERVLISEVLVRNKDGEELQRKDLEAEALQALKACRANSALTVREVQEDVHRIINSGYFCSCMPVAVDTRDGIRLVFQVEPNQEFKGLVCEGANVLPAKFLEDSFRDGYGKVINLRRLDEAISSINGWYMERGLFAMVTTSCLYLSHNPE
ncbi:Outer envelope protein 80, chloroplastic [Stylosanthes scabra]|uniref:Outer envelope protein 80, chloroplastic n=1 Tax=Stylosanthes scabra TaxID=79078 RepID=A0ABU6VB03_9FABA|nr:Outer envelope protein 80, chloroplastic [Stylosanthes scabra]